MTDHSKKPVARRLEKVAHYIAAFVLILKGIDKLQNPDKFPYGIMFLVLAALLILGNLFHHKAEKVFKYFTLYVFIIEFMAISLVGYLYMKEGKQFIQYACFFTALMFLVGAIVYWKKTQHLRA